jgi:mannose-6-phosphate isomerase
MEAFRERLCAGGTSLTWERAHLEKMFQTYGTSDVGIPTSLLMNWVQITPGSAVYVGPNELHAYLEGDIIECMATSDNVVRAGLTPKFQDTVELLAMVAGVPRETVVLSPRALNGSGVASIYQTPATEFQLIRICGQNGEQEDFSFSSASLVLCTSGSIQLDTKGHSLIIREGQVALVPAIAGPFSVTTLNAEGFVASVPIC